MATKKRGSKSPKSKTFTTSDHREIQIDVSEGRSLRGALLSLIIDGQDVLRVEYHPGGRGDAMEDALADAGRLAETLAFMQAAGSVHVTQHGS